MGLVRTTIVEQRGEGQLGYLCPRSRWVLRAHSPGKISQMVDDPFWANRSLDRSLVGDDEVDCTQAQLTKIVALMIEFSSRCRSLQQLKHRGNELQRPPSALDIITRPLRAISAHAAIEYLG